jgi:hypothetical protein
MQEGYFPIRFIEGAPEDKRKAVHEVEDKRKGKVTIAYRCPNCNYIELFRG